MLTPIDIQNRELKSKMGGGYDKKDVDDFLLEINASYEELYKENQGLKEKITSLSEGIQYYKKMETTLQKALVLAEKTSSETQEAAKSQADSVMTQASVKAEALSRETKAEIESLRREAQAQAEITKAKANRELEETRNHVRKLVQSYENYRLQFKKLAEAQIEMLDSESFSIFVPELDELMNDAPSADGVMDDPGIIPINIGSPAPFVELPDEPAEPPKVEEVPVENVSFSVPVSSEGSFGSLPQEDTMSVAASIPDIAPVAEEPASIPVSIPTMNAAPMDMPPVEEVPVNITPTVEAPMDMAPMGEIPVNITPTAEAPMDMAPMGEIPVNVPPMGGMPVDMSPVGEMPVNASPMAGMPMNNMMAPIGEPAPEQTSAVSIDTSAMTAGNEIGFDTGAAPADPMLMDISGMAPASEPAFTSAPQNDMFVGTDSPFDTAGNDSMMMGAAEPMAPANDMLGGIPANDIPVNITPTNDMFTGAEPAPANDILAGTQMSGLIGGEPPVNDLFAGAEPAAPANNGILGGDGMNDMLGGMTPAPAPASAAMDNGMMDMSSFMDTPAPAPAPEPAAPAASNNGIIADPMMDMGGMMDIPNSTPAPAPAPAAQPQDNIMDMNPFNFIDP